MRLLRNNRLYRVASATGHAARVFAAAVFLSFVLFHYNEGALVVAPLAMAAGAVLLVPAAILGARAPH